MRGGDGDRHARVADLADPHPVRDRDGTEVVALIQLLGRLRREKEGPGRDLTELRLCGKVSRSWERASPGPSEVIGSEP